MVRKREVATVPEFPIYLYGGKISFDLEPALEPRVVGVVVAPEGSRLFNDVGTRIVLDVAVDGKRAGVRLAPGRARETGRSGEHGLSYRDLVTLDPPPH